MSDPKDPKNAEFGLSKTAISYLDEVALEIYYGRRSIVKTDPILKGEYQEKEAIDLVSEVTGLNLKKNTERKENEYFTGEHDIEHYHEGNKIIRDIKVPYDIWTFHKAKPPTYEVKGKKKYTEYGYQLLSYMDLNDAQGAYLDYCLMDTPDHILSSILYRGHFKFEQGDENPEYELWRKQIIKNHTFYDIPIEKRVKSFYVERDDEEINKMKDKVKKANKYLENWTL